MHRTDDREPDLSLVLGLQRATHEVDLYLRRALADLAVSQAEAHVLAYLSHHGPSLVAELHRAFGHRRSTLTSVLDRLEGRGFVIREVHVLDRRSLRVVPTPHGAAVAARVAAALATFEARIRERVTADDIAGWQAVLTAIEESTT